MNLVEILQLDKVQSSIKKIDLFLVSQIKLSNEYLIALSYKASILHKMGKTNEALKLLFTMVPYFKEMDVDGIISICDGIISICLDLRRFDQVSKYIKIKQNYLPISKAVLHIKDNIKLYIATRKYEEAKAELLKYLEDDITLEESIFAKEELSNIYFMENQYALFLEIASELERYYQNNLALSSLASLEIKELKATFELGNYLKVISNGLNYIQEEALSNGQKLVVATLLMRSYLLGNDYKRASIIESEYCEFIDEEHIDESLEFCYVALELYTKTNTLVSITEYQNMIRELEQSRKEAKVKKRKKAKNEEIVIPVVPQNIEEEEQTISPINITSPSIKDIQAEIRQKVEAKVEVVKPVVVSQTYERLASIFQTINELDLSLKFREVFRNCCIKICEIFPIEEIYVLYYKRQYLGVHYKKERAYDKKLKFEDLQNTLSFAAMNYENEVFLESDSEEYSKSIVTNKKTEFKYGFALPFVDNLKSFGSIAFFSNVEFISEEMMYESLKLISSMLNTRLLQSLRQDELQFNNRKLFFMNENMSSGMKEEMDGYYHFSSQAAKILGVLEDMTEEDYLSKMKSQDIIRYRNIHDELYTLLSEGTELEYDFKRDDHWIRVKERYYPMVYDGIICILSLIDDITLEEKNKEQLISLAYQNPISKLDTEVKLMIDLNQFMDNHKLSVAVIDIIDFNLYREMYGFNFSNQLIYTVGRELKQANENDFNAYVYHLELDRYVILFNEVNDKRAIDSKLRTIFQKVCSKLFELNYRVKLSFNAGVYRLARHTSSIDAAKILQYALDALADAKSIPTNTNHICHFDSDSFKRKFNENQLITHISESIDHAKIGLTYKQIIDYSKKEVFAYMLRLNLDNYEVDYSLMDFVVKRRGLTTDLEKYAISNLFKELKFTYENLKGYILCFIELSDATLNESFLSFLDAQKTFYKIPNEYIVFHTTNANQTAIKQLRAQGYKISSSEILDVYLDLCDYFMLDIHKLTIHAIQEVQEICSKHDIQCIFSHVDTKEDLEMISKLEDILIYGEYYHKAIRIKTLVEKMKV